MWWESKKVENKSSINFPPNQVNFYILVSHFEFPKFECKFVISDLENPQVPIFIEIEELFFLRAFGTHRKIFLVAEGVKHEILHATRKLNYIFNHSK